MLAEIVTAGMLIGAANAADAVVAHHGIEAGWAEPNPIIGSQGERMLPVKVLTVAAETAIFAHLLRTEHRRAAWVWVAAVVGVNTYMAIQNRNAGGRQR